MLTFQILDGGETYYRPLDERPITIGSSNDADIRFEESGVAAVHAHVELMATAEGAEPQCTIRCATADATIRVNGEDLRESVLVLGDRVEIGDSVLVVGNQVQRPATAADVLVSGSTRRRIPFEHDRRSKQVKRMYVIVALVGVALCMGIYQWGWAVQDTHLPLQDRERIVNARKHGHFDEARAMLDRLEREWVLTDAQRGKVVADHRELVENTAIEFEKLHTRYMAEVLTTSKSKQLRSLRALPQDASFAEEEAARIMMAGLTEYRLAAEELARTNRVAATGQPAGADNNSGTGTGDAVAKTGKREPPPPPAWLDETLAEIRRLSKAGQHVQAYETARQVLPEVAIEHAEPLRDLLADVRTATRVEMRRLVARAFALRKSGRVGDGVKVLRDASIRFPTEGELSLLHRVLGNLSAEIGVPMPERRDVAVRGIPTGPDRRIVKSDPVKGASGKGSVSNLSEVDVDPTEVDEATLKAFGLFDTSVIESTKAEVEAATRAGDLDEAVALLDKAIGEYKEFQPRIANLLRDEAANLKLIQNLAFAIVGSADAIKGRSIKLADGGRGSVEMIDGQTVHLSVNGKTQVVPWLRLTVEGFEALAAAADVSSEARLGIGALGYQRGEAAQAEAYLAKLVARNTGLLDAVSSVVSRGRGEVVGKDGYAVVRGGFVAKRFLKVEKLAAIFGRRLSRIANQTTAERAKVLEELRDESGDGVDDALALALKNRLDQYVAKFAKSRLPKALKRLGDLRVELDKARQHARSLIYDRKTYFYPYKPPAVSGERHSEYNKVQKEVDARVRVVRALWRDKTKVPVNPATKKEIDALLWFEEELDRMGEVTDRALAKVAWVRMIPPVAEITIRSYCKGAEERENYVHWMKIVALNEALSKDLGAASAAQVRITNSYRLMFGHRPLAVSRKLHEAAQGHAIEMAELGYFSHHSPTPKNKTPYMRMRSQGYQYGISENIARNGSANGAHIAWTHSSGHHRNLLNAGHTEFAVGSTGSIWVQNFGRGKEYVDDEKFPR